MSNSAEDLALLDTNVLVYAEQRQEEHHEAAKTLRDRALAGDISACVSFQVLSEFFSVTTNTGPRGPARPLTAEEARDQVQKYYESEHLTIIYPDAETSTVLLTLLEDRPVTGPEIYDLILAATMLSNGVTRICTFNTKDFEPIPGIEVLNPQEIDA